MKTVNFISGVARNFLMILFFAGFGGLIVFGIGVLLGMTGKTSLNDTIAFLALCLFLALVGNLKLYRPKQTGCAACDRGDHQLGHHHNCPKAKHP